MVLKLTVGFLLLSGGHASPAE